MRGGVPLESATVVGPIAGGVTGGLHRGPAETRVIMRRAIVFQNEADGANLGECFSIEVPHSGDEVVIPGIRARVTRVVYQYQQTEYEIEGEKAENARTLTDGNRSRSKSFQPLEANR